MNFGNSGANENIFLNLLNQIGTLNNGNTLFTFRPSDLNYENNQQNENVRNLEDIFASNIMNSMLNDFILDPHMVRLQPTIIEEDEENENGYNTPPRNPSRFERNRERIRQRRERRREIRDFMSVSRQLNFDAIFSHSFNFDNQPIVFTNEEKDLASVVFFDIRDDWKKSTLEETGPYQNLNLIDTYGRDIGTTQTIDNEVIALMVKFLNQVERVTYKNFVNFVYDNRCTCGRFEGYIIDQIKSCIEHTLFIKGKLLNCNEFGIVLEYFVIHKRIPTDDEIEYCIRREMDFVISPEEFHQKDKMFIPAKNIEKLPLLDYCKKENEEDDCCSICQDNFEDKQKIIKLLPCNHTFHYNNLDCLESKSIINWLENYNFCPLCKTKVNID